ncbi:MAG: hypothetical protein A3H27_12145 [Acidobacteria bacterium RIFCSPLOWO2_02_FULL_59_13]|nr:MAG: hypothetical protein A3H27_12145 [Acidobacteria bacterium RIFCSPLOWO2_02_FULL_59_13]
MSERELRRVGVLAQFGRMCWKLGTKIVGASSPQAKGLALEVRKKVTRPATNHPWKKWRPSW